MTVLRLAEKRGDRSADDVLEGSLGEYDNILIVGWDKEGTMLIEASSGFNRKDILWMLEQAKLDVLMPEVC